MKRTIAQLAGLATLVTGLAGGAAMAQDYPYRDITTAVVWGAGGGTDTINRMIMAEMEKHLPVSINVINQTGGVAGSNGMVYVMNQPDDGYTLVGLSESNVTAAVQGGWDKKFDYWYPFIVGGSPDLISVPANSPYDTLEALVEAAKVAPGTIPAAASGAGSIHHLNLLALQNGVRRRVQVCPVQGIGARARGRNRGRGCTGRDVLGRTGCSYRRRAAQATGHAYAGSGGDRGHNRSLGLFELRRAGQVSAAQAGNRVCGA